MRILSIVGAAAIMAAGAGLLRAEALDSGIDEGGKIGAYTGVKLGGADDGVEVGKSLCYT